MSQDQDPSSLERRARAGVPREVRSLGALEEVRLLLRGGSVVDWVRLNYQDLDDVWAFLRTHGADPDDPRDRGRLAELRDEAIFYLEHEHGYRIPIEHREGEPTSLFLLASEEQSSRRRVFACLILKTMHIIHHLQARELRDRIPLAEETIAQALIAKVESFAHRLRDEGFPLTFFKGGEKPRASLVTKLLLKREHHAAAIGDRIRFRFVVDRDSDLIPLLHRICRELIPYNYVVPGQTVNQLVNFTALVESHEAYRGHADGFQVTYGIEDRRLRPDNEFSGPGYRVINCIADMPVRVPDALLGDKELEGLGRVVFELIELQLVDAKTAAQNEAGENTHPLYKARQLAKVRERLERGLGELYE